MLFNLLKAKCCDTAETGTYADGAFDLPRVEITETPRRLRGHVAHQRDYGCDRIVAPIPAGFA